MGFVGVHDIATSPFGIYSQDITVGFMRVCLQFVKINEQLGYGKTKVMDRINILKTTPKKCAGTGVRAGSNLAKSLREVIATAVLFTTAHIEVTELDNK